MDLLAHILILDDHHLVIRFVWHWHSILMSMECLPLFARIFCMHGSFLGMDLVLYGHRPDITFVWHLHMILMLTEWLVHTWDLGQFFSWHESHSQHHSSITFVWHLHMIWMSTVCSLGLFAWCILVFWSERFEVAFWCFGLDVLEHGFCITFI